MYRKEVGILSLCILILGSFLIFQVPEIKVTSNYVPWKSSESKQRNINFYRMERKSIQQTPCSENERELLCKIVEAEAGIEDYKGKQLVASVVLNRVKSSRFPDTIQEVIYQKSGQVYQFSPVVDGAFQNVDISEETRKAVDTVLNGEDRSKGALYFTNREQSNPVALNWLDEKCIFLFQYGQHEFYM